MRSVITCLMIGSMILMLAGPAPADNLVLQVPDWNQPNSYLGAGAGYPDWCSPTAGGNLMGYWEDVIGLVGLTDRQAFPASPAYPGTALTWEQGLYHDGMIEMGWWMDTGNWQTNPSGPNFPVNAGGTGLVDILPGLLSYAQNGWTDDDFGPNAGTGIVKVAYPNAAGYTDTIRDGVMWSNYTGEIDAARPAELSFQYWVDTIAPGQPMTIAGFEAYPAETYGWFTQMDPHSVVGVGYIDLTPGFQNDGTDEWFVCQDGWGTTGQLVAVPLNSFWLQNDYITAVPEPSSIILLIVGAISAMAYGWRRRGVA